MMDLLLIMVSCACISFGSGIILSVTRSMWPRIAGWMDGWEGSCRRLMEVLVGVCLVGTE
jgi:hypothetical protein